MANENIEQSTKELEKGTSKAFTPTDSVFANFACDDMPFDPNESLGIKSSFGTKEESIRKMHQVDPVLGGLWYTLEARILGLDRVIEKQEGDKGEKDFIDDAFSRISKWQEKLGDILSAIQIGNSFTELIYMQDGRFWTLDPTLGGLIVRPPSKFCYKQDKDGTFKLMYDPFGCSIMMMDCMNLNAELLDPRKFKVMTYNAAYGNPIGQGVYNDLYNYWWLKKEEVKLYGLLGEVYVFPKTIFMPDSPDGYGEGDREIIDGFAKTPTAGTAIRVERAIRAVILNQNLTDPGKAHEMFINFCNLSMAYRLHGQGLALNEAAGSQAKERVRMELFNFLIESYITGLEYFINNEIIKQLCDLNFENPIYPVWNIVRPEAADPKNWVEAIDLAVKMGTPVGTDWFKGKLGIPDTQEGEDTLETTESESRMQAFSKALDVMKSFVYDYGEHIK